MADPSERIGQNIGDYRLTRYLGKGTFGMVYLSEHLHDHSQAAVKILQIQLSSRNDLRDFLNEARTIRLRHPYIVPLLDFGLSRDDMPFLVMEYADGGTLRDRHTRGSQLSWETVDSYVQQLAAALQYAHDRRIIHRDVKPENMLVRDAGKVQLSDFGIARIIEQSSLVSLHRLAGTPAYTAPEQSRGKPSQASDQYALAVVVYEWIVGQRPFQGGPLEVLIQHRTDDPPSLRELRPETPEHIEQIVLKALAKEPEERFQTITHFAQALHTELQKVSPATQSLSGLTALQRSIISGNLIQPKSIPSEQKRGTFSFPISNSSFNKQGNVPDETVPTFLLAPDPAPISNPHSLKAADTPSPSWPVQRISTNHPAIQPSSTRGPWFPVIRLRVLIISFCVVLLLGSGGAAWFFVAQQDQQQASLAAASARSVTKTAIATSSLATKTAQANEYLAATVQGVQFGFDAAHTRWNHYEHGVNATNVSTLKQLWSYQTGYSIDYSSPVEADGIVYIGSRDGKLYAFDATCRSSCQPLWSYATGGGISSSPAVANGIIYIGSDDYKLYAFDASCRSSCQPIWSYQTGYVISSSPTVADGVVYVSSGDTRLYAFDATCRSACQPYWSYQTGYGITSSPAVANGIVYVGSSDDKLYAFDAACRNSCQPIWSYQTGGAISSSPTVAGGVVYVGSDDYKLYAFDAACRSACHPFWSYQTGGTIISSPAVASGLVYIGSYDTRLYAFDANCRSNCHPSWSYQTGDSIDSSPTVANGVVYIGSHDHKLYAFDGSCLSGCQPLWIYQTGDSINSSPMVANGTVYVGSHDHKLYAFGLPA